MNHYDDIKPMKKSQGQNSISSSESKFTHQELGQRLDLFSFHDIAPGAPFWHEKGIIIFRELEKYARKLNDENGYEEISTPIIVKRELFEQSGHWEHYRDNMFWFDNPRDENEHLVIKPMNCPESTFVYKSTIRSYKDLPVRLAEIGRLHRNELSGTLGGLLRVRQITMDDAHIYIRMDQTREEVSRILDIIEKFYKILGLDVTYILAKRPESALGTKKDWNIAEKGLENCLETRGVKFDTDEHGGAFYGPKIEVHIRDSQNRDWQFGTVQLDIMLPKQFKLAYVDENGKKQMPWVIHRAIFGSFERFIGILLEHTQGALPFWLSPIQTAILPISNATTKYASEVCAQLKTNNIRSWLDHRNETIGKKIREAEMQKIPYLLVVGQREIESKTVALRERGRGDRGQLKIEEFLGILKKESLLFF